MLHRIIIFHCMMLCLLFCLPLSATPYPQNYISQFGQQVLSQCSLIVRGIPQKIWLTPHGGGNCVSFQVKEIYQGQIALNQIIQIFSLEISQFRQNEQWIVFLKPISTSYSFHLVGNFSMQEKEAPAKVEMLKKLLILEIQPQSPEKQYAYLEFCFSGLTSSYAWTRSNAWQEWRYFVENYSQILKIEHFIRLREICEQIPEFTIRQSLEKDLVWLKKKIPKSDSPETSPLLMSAILAQAQNDIRNSSLDIQISAIHTLGKIPCHSSQLALQQCLSNQQAQIRALAVFYLGKQTNPASISAIRHVLYRDQNLGVKRFAIQALCEMGATSAIPDIQPYLQIPYTQHIAEKAINILQKKQDSTK